MNQRKTAIITGATKGLGRALTFAFAQEGYNLGICARGKEHLQEIKEEVQRMGTEIVTVQADAANGTDVDRFISVVENHFGRVDVVINNASSFGPGPTLLMDYPQESFEEVVRTNTSSAFLMTKRALPGMLARNKGTIINVTSEVGKTGLAEWGAYSVSKFGLEGLTAVWADELSDTNISIHLVDPGEMDTEMHHIAVPDCDYELAKPEDITYVFLYLASDASKEANGSRHEAQHIGGDNT
ncbi:SDR family oxidoreductase [Pontibacillus salicampi]|uniref:SDR family oxidoreductase n=1 Tax=Pontibacillus salicampi TaxID=1449801 RepID=A0ABV6LLX4_9BACI